MHAILARCPLPGGLHFVLTLRPRVGCRLTHCTVFGSLCITMPQCVAQWAPCAVRRCCHTFSQASECSPMACGRPKSAGLCDVHRSSPKHYLACGPTYRLRHRYRFCDRCGLIWPTHRPHGIVWIVASVLDAAPRSSPKSALFAVAVGGHDADLFTDELSFYPSLTLYRLSASLRRAPSGGNAASIVNNTVPHRYRGPVWHACIGPQTGPNQLGHNHIVGTRARNPNSCATGLVYTRCLCRVSSTARTCGLQTCLRNSAILASSPPFPAPWRRVRFAAYSYQRRSTTMRATLLCASGSSSV